MRVFKIAEEVIDRWIYSSEYGDGFSEFQVSNIFGECSWHIKIGEQGSKTTLQQGVRVEMADVWVGGFDIYWGEFFIEGFESVYCEVHDDGLIGVIRYSDQ